MGVGARVRVRVRVRVGARGSSSAGCARAAAAASSLASTSPLSPLYLPSISPLSPLYLPSISPLSPLYLPSISPLSRHLRLEPGEHLARVLGAPDLRLHSAAQGELGGGGYLPMSPNTSLYLRLLREAILPRLQRVLPLLERGRVPGRYREICMEI